jgi:Domain of unknown function (DUF4383)
VAQQMAYPSRTGDRLVSDLGAAKALRAAAFAFGLVFLVLGVAGFIPGLTTDVDEMQMTGHESGAELFGLFQVSGLHNAVHILFGLAGLAAARRWHWARAYLIVSGIAYLGLTVYGLVVDTESEDNFVPLDDADNWLHLGLGVAMLGLGLALRPRVHRELSDHDHRVGGVPTARS